jgi:hypothetical protein
MVTLRLAWLINVLEHGEPLGVWVQIEGPLPLQFWKSRLTPQPRLVHIESRFARRTQPPSASGRGSRRKALDRFGTTSDKTRLLLKSATVCLPEPYDRSGRRHFTAKDPPAEQPGILTWGLKLRVRVRRDLAAQVDFLKGGSGPIHLLPLSRHRRLPQIVQALCRGL